MTLERQQARNGRRGYVFPLRITDDVRAKLEAAQRADDGPRALGPWLVWRVLRAVAGEAPRRQLDLVEVIPASPRARVLPPVHERTILDLCGGSGAWSEPYRAAGYRVVVVDLPEDVRTYRPPERGVWGVLAAPPCDQFSLARNGHPELPRDIIGGLEVVSACMRIILLSNPEWWALENPVGLLSGYLGTPLDVFEPCDFGDPWTKRTALWGRFALPERGPFVKPQGGGPFCLECDPQRRRTTWCGNALHRARTPPGFARAFFEANP